MQGRLKALVLVAATLAGCEAIVTVEGTIEPRLFARSKCEFFMQSPTWRSLSLDILESDFIEGLPASPFGSDLYTVRVDCKAPDGTLLASRQEIVTLGRDVSTLYMGLISTERQKAPGYEPEWIAKTARPGVALDVETPPPPDPTCPRRESPSAYPQAFDAIERRLAEDGQQKVAMKRLNRLAHRNGWLLVEAEYERLGPMSFLLESDQQGYAVKSYFVGTTPSGKRSTIIRTLFEQEAPNVPPDLLACLLD
ncbi:hypothetical protein [Pseudomonas sp. PDM13]|uniref:hypothetical protein n=1 Tax=Pseudomonas sp. PDM13 TaxID=2769255 RepID=UPI0021DFF125|nr:hypothetical protein [Pseudomonas sp. PDM13]MCU9949408.1 hypothetical protein [Pseudomonas sp. PDM13]